MLAEAMRPAVAELLLAAEWYEQIDTCMARGDAIVESVIECIRSGEIDGADGDKGRADRAAQRR
jgi:hypothetical protein